MDTYTKRILVMQTKTDCEKDCKMRAVIMAHSYLTDVDKQKRNLDLLHYCMLECYRVQRNFSTNLD